VSARALLIDPPRFPRGALSLSLASVAASLRPAFEPRLLDLDFEPRDSWERLLAAGPAPALIGLKVSAQNLREAEEVSRLARRVRPGAAVVWGGELPTLRPDLARGLADAVVRGRFEGVAEAFVADARAGRLRPEYDGTAVAAPPPVPALDLVERPERYVRFLGTPLEASLGCSEHCTFCMVHSMQPAGRELDAALLRRDLEANPRDFASVVDYNLGDGRERLLAAAAALERSAVRGWTCEACLESLDDGEVLAALARARCRVVYCGLESVSEAALRSVAKTQNAVSEYRRVIRRAQDAGIDVASGYILGLAGQTAADAEAFADFAEEAGLAYVKLTFLTFNPGTKALASMAARGRVLTEDPAAYDGVRPTWLPPGVEAADLRAQAARMIARLYSWRSAWRRSRHLAGRPAARAEFVLLSRCFGEAYRDWSRLGALGPGEPRLLDAPFAKPARLAACEALLSGARRLRS
jgi:radical SAM superfamily enzyme YgiQ (UPF0313 family)